MTAENDALRIFVRVRVGGMLNLKVPSDAA